MGFKISWLGRTTTTPSEPGEVFGVWEEGVWDEAIWDAGVWE
jgi:hypothetical protein